MGILSDWQIIELVHSGELIIDPFDEQLVQPATYDLRLGDKILASPLGPTEPGGIIELTARKPTYKVNTGQMVSVKSAEWLELPLSIASGSFGIRSHYAYVGFYAFGGVLLDPGFHGVVIMNLQNVGPEPIALTMNDRFFTVQFERLDQPAAKGYDGPNQGQRDLSPDLEKFITTAQTTSLAEIPELRRNIAYIRGQQMVHETSVHGAPRAVALLELAAAKGIKPLENPDKLFGRWPEGEDFDAFLESIRSTREWPE